MPATTPGASASARTHSVLRWSRRIFLAIGFLSLGYCAFVLIDARIYQANQARLFQEQQNDQKLAAVSSDALREPSFHPAVGDAVGQLAISRIGVAAMVLEGTDDETLWQAVGHITGTALPGQHGNVGFAGHRDTFFRALRNIRQDDEITVTTINAAYRYRVDSTRVVGPDDIQVLNNSGDDVLTLVTCYPFYFVGPAPRRFIVRAQQIPR